MSRSALHLAEIKRIAQFWDGANILTELIASVESRGCQRGGRRCGGGRWTILMAAVCASVSSAILAYCSMWQLSATDTRTYATVVGEQKAIFLSDGSSIQLNTDSEVKVSYSGIARSVRLLRGEGHFSVTPDSNRPFEVYAAGSAVRAVGTAFAVHLEGHRVDVTVEKGAVDLSDVESTRSAAGQTSTEAAPLTSNLGRLNAGEVGSFDSVSGHMEVRQMATLELRRRMAWQEGDLAFAGEPLSETVAQLNRYSTTRLVIGDPKLASLKMGGRFRIGDLDTVLDFLRTTFGIRAREVSGGTIRLESESTS
jgi:transmembrane sensor